MSPDEARQIVKEIVDQACEKSRGNAPGHLAEYIKELSVPIINWRQELRLYVGRHTGGRRVTYSRRNRRRDEFGMPGISHRAASTITVIVDTSGSVSSEELKSFFTEIEAFSHTSKISILQWDHDFQGYTQKYRKGDWKKFKVNGRGGTDMAAPVEWLEENNLVTDVVIMFTDGECNWPSKKEFPMMFVISNQRDITPAEWGKTIYLK